MGDITFYHHGIRGQKWGIRRYQNSDGSLTPEGRKRYGDGSDSSGSGKQNRSFFSRLRQKTSIKKKSSSSSSDKKEESKEEAPKKKSISEMSDQELQSAINRMRLEQQYMSMLPKPVEKPKNSGKIKTFVDKLVDEAIIPGATQAGKNLLQKTLEKYVGESLGLNKKQEKSLHDQLKEEMDILTYRSNIKKFSEELNSGKNKSETQKRYDAVQKQYEEIATQKKIKQMEDEIYEYNKSSWEAQKQQRSSAEEAAAYERMRKAAENFVNQYRDDEKNK